MPSKRLKSKEVTVTGGGGTTVVDPFTDTFSLHITTTEANAAPTDAESFAIALTATDTNAEPTETVGLNISGHNDTNVAPTDANTFTLLVWLSACAGTGVTDPANANGANNGTTATVQTSLTNPNVETMTATLGANIPNGVSVTSAIFRCWFQGSNILITSNCQIALDWSGGTTVAYFNQGLNQTNNHLSGNFTFDLIAAGIDTLAELQSITVRFRCSDAAAGVQPCTLTVDAACIELAGAFT